MNGALGKKTLDGADYNVSHTSWKKATHPTTSLLQKDYFDDHFDTAKTPKPAKNEVSSLGPHRNIFRIFRFSFLHPQFLLFSIKNNPLFVYPANVDLLE